MMKTMEIGSEFEKYKFDFSISYEKSVYKHIHDMHAGKYELLMSGRTAINYVLDNITIQKKIVYMPDFCCESMVMPFIKRGYKVVYYEADVINNRYNIDINIDCGIFFAMSYFGYSCSNLDDYINKFSSIKDVIVIEDITHRLFCKTSYCEKSDYLIASLRKWFPILSGGLAVCLKNNFIRNTDDYTENKILEVKKDRAMSLKKTYLETGSGNKQEFLDLFHDCEKMFDNYKNKLMDKESLNILKNLDCNYIIQKRRKNALVIEEKLKKLNNIRLLYQIGDDDCPLFVPIVTENRNEIRQKLICENIYCPIHWPNFNKFKNKIYDREISLVCDQRYSEDEISQYIDKFIKIVGD